MKVKDIIKLIQDPKIYIELVELESLASFGFYTKQELFYNDKRNKEKVKQINIQYYNGKRLLILYI